MARSPQVIKNDRWIREMALTKGLINPF